MQISNSVHALSEELIEIRRKLHRIPELGFEEVKTKEYIRNYLEKLSPDMLEVGLGVKAVFWNNAEKTLAFRADIDALPIKEETGLPFSSEHDGIMHACGHDGHTAILLAFAKLVSQNKAALKHNIVLIFQPNEESAAGAKVLIENGILENPKVDAIYGLHIWPEFEKHQIVLKKGALMSGMDDFYITFKGKRAHGAMPHLGCDAITAAATFITGVQSVISRNISPFDSAVFTVGMINGGTAPNILAETVELGCTLRAFSEKTLSFTKERIVEYAESIASAYRASVSFRRKTGGFPVVNDEKLFEHAKELFMDADINSESMVMPSEDFCYYQREIPGLFMLLGSRDKTHNAALHSVNYILNEEILAEGVEIFRRIAEIDD